MKSSLSACVFCVVLAAFWGVVLSRTIDWSGATSDRPCAARPASPEVVVLDVDGAWLTVWVDLPVGDVSPSTVAMSGVAPSWLIGDEEGDVLAAFNLEALRAAAGLPWGILVLTGQTRDGRDFAGTCRAQME